MLQYVFGPTVVSRARQLIRSRRTKISRHVRRTKLAGNEWGDVRATRGRLQHLVPTSRPAFFDEVDDDSDRLFPCEFRRPDIPPECPRIFPRKYS